MYLQVVKKLLKCNFYSWNNEFMNNILNLLKSGEENQILYALKFFKKLAKQYEFEQSEKELYFNDFMLIQVEIEKLFESITLNNLFNNEISNLIINSILKIYQSSIRVC